MAAFRFFFFACFCIKTIGCIDAEKAAPAHAQQKSHFSIKGIGMVAPQKPIDLSSIQPMLNVNANSIAVMPYAFFSIENPEVRYNQHGQHWGENTDGVTGCIKLAHQKKISVMLKPHLWIGHGVYTGAFTLTSEKEWQIWEASYQKYILHFAAVADSMKAEIFCIGVELGEAIKQRPAFWNALIDTIKQTYHGKLTYAANWDDYESFPFWEKLDYIGVDAYFPLTKDKTPNVKALKRVWQKYNGLLEQISLEHNRPVLFTEYGYRNVDYNTTEPWKENDDGQNDEAQVNAYEAFYQNFAGKKWFAGGYVWKWYVTGTPQHRSAIDFSPQGKPVLKLIENWYGN